MSRPDTFRVTILFLLLQAGIMAIGVNNIAHVLSSRVLGITVSLVAFAFVLWFGRMIRVARWQGIAMNTCDKVTILVGLIIVGLIQYLGLGDSIGPDVPYALIDGVIGVVLGVVLRRERVIQIGASGGFESVAVGLLMQGFIRDSDLSAYVGLLFIYLMPMPFFFVSFRAFCGILIRQSRST